MGALKFQRLPERQQAQIPSCFCLCKAFLCRFVLVFSILYSSSSFHVWRLRRARSCIIHRVIFSLSWRKMEKPKISCWQKVATGGAQGSDREPSQGRSKAGLGKEASWIGGMAFFVFFLPALGSNSLRDVEDWSAILLQGYFPRLAMQWAKYRHREGSPLSPGPSHTLAQCATLKLLICEIYVREPIYTMRRTKKQGSWKRELIEL